MLALLTSLSAVAGELKLTIDPILKPHPKLVGDTNLYRIVTVTYVGAATNYFSFQLIPSETPNGVASTNLGTGIRLSTDKDWKTIIWAVSPNAKPAMFFRARLFSEK